MDATKAMRLSDFITLPNPEEGAVKAVTTSADANGLDMRLIGAVVADTTKQGSETGLGTVDHYVTLIADGADVYITSGPTKASVTGANAPSIAALGVGVLGTPATGICFRIPNGATFPCIPTVDRPWVNWVGSAAGTLRIFKSSK